MKRCADAQQSTQPKDRSLQEWQRWRSRRAGRYAVQAFLDENGNGEVDRALFGIPKEGVGFSNDAKIRLGKG